MSEPFAEQPPLPDGYEWCTTWSRRKRHISNDLSHRNKRGREGSTLCKTNAYDEEAMRWWLEYWMTDPDRASKFDSTKLDPCKPCLSRMGRIEAGAA